jgi:hypothetical protein
MKTMEAVRCRTGYILKIGIYIAPSWIRYFFDSRTKPILSDTGDTDSVFSKLNGCEIGVRHKSNITYISLRGYILLYILIK